MADYWIKMYHEIIDDPKMATMPDRLWRRAIEIFLLAGKLSKNKNGVLPETNQLAWLLRMQTDELLIDLKQLETAGIIKKIPDGWLVVNFEKRQSASLPSERMRQHREQKQKQEYYEDVTQPVTNLLRNVTQNTEYRIHSQNTESEAETDARVLQQPTDRFDEIQRWLEKNTGFPASGADDVNTIQELATLEITEEDVKNAIGWLSSQGKACRRFSSLLNPIKISYGKRVQEANGNGNVKKESILDRVIREEAEKERIRQERGY